MRICILSTGNTPIGFLDNDVPNALHFYDDKLHVYLTGTAHTLELSVIASDEAAELLAVGNKLAFYYEGRPYYLNIVSTSQTETEIEVEAWAYCLELLNENALVYEPTEAKSFIEYFKAMIYCNDMFEVGINEVSTATRSTKYSSTSDTLLKRLYSLASDFDAELEFVPKLNGDYSLDTFEMNVYKEHSDTDQGVGEKRTDAYFRYGKDVDGITKTQDITELYTMIVPTGKDNLTIASIGERKIYDDDGMLLYDHPSGSEGIYAPLACQNFPSAVTSKDKYIRYDWSTDYETAESLYGNALAKLKELSTPESTYEIKGSIDVNIGDTITVIDEAFSPSLYLETRVTEQEICFTDPSKNSTTFSNTKELESQIDEALTKRVTELEKEAVETAAKAAEAAAQAQAASETATTAQSTAEAAQTTANTASETASTAQTTAESAKTTAEGVEAIATEAKTTAESASTAASTAQSAAESASTAASEAKTEAQNASSAASTAQSTAEAASTAASTAQSTAESAQSTANTANETATAAQTTANTANETATAAQTTATEAKAATDNLDTLIRATTDGVEVARIDSAGAYTGMRTEQTADAYLIKDKDGNTLASYGADTVELGKGNENAVINMCDETLKIQSTASGSLTQGEIIFTGDRISSATVGVYDSDEGSGVIFKQSLGKRAYVAFNATAELEEASSTSGKETYAKFNGTVGLYVDYGAKLWLNYNYRATGYSDKGEAYFDIPELITALDLLTNYANAGNHNSIYRGKYLGSSVTDDQYAQIAAGTFKDLYIGDYWTINSVNYRIAAFDYFYDRTSCWTHHIVIVPDQCFGAAVMNTSATTSGGYASANLRSSGLKAASTAVDAAFGLTNHVLELTLYLCNAVSNGAESGWASKSCRIELMTEQMVFGDKPSYMHYESTQLPLFALNPTLITTRYANSSDTGRKYWWLQDVASTSEFRSCAYSGLPINYAANTELAVRPYFCIYGG